MLKEFVVMKKIQDTAQMLIDRMLKDGYNPVYEVFVDVPFLQKVHASKVLWRGRYSERSLMFDDDLKDVFGLTDPTFDSHFQKATSGKGHEISRIKRLHSSSLIALLCFHRVSKSSPIIFNVDGKEIKFTSVEFEFDEGLVGYDEKNEPHFSNIDVKLVSEDGSVILLLESKFTEYLSFGKQTEISDYVYTSYYNEMSSVINQLGLVYRQQTDEHKDVVPGKMCLESAKGNTQLYAQGLKQMLSHTLGACHYAKTQSGVQVYLATIIFRFPNHIDNGKLANYANAYRTWCGGLNQLSCVPPNLKVIESPYVYQEVFDKQNLELVPERAGQYYKFL